MHMYRVVPITKPENLQCMLNVYIYTMMYTVYNWLML